MAAIDGVTTVLDSCGDLWEVVTVIRPNPHDCFVLCKRKTNCVHSDGTPGIEMYLFDYNNDELYRDSLENRDAIERVKKVDEAKEAIKETILSFWEEEDDE